MSASKFKVDLVVLGGVKRFVNIKKLKSWKSKLFNISNVFCRDDLAESSNVTFSYNHEYNDKDLWKMMGKDTDTLRIGLIYADLERNFYIRILSAKTIVCSIKTPKEYLDVDSISIENFLLRNIYMLVARTKIGYRPEVETDGTHSDLRGCLFDLNGDLSGVIYNTEKPILCSECKAKISKSNLPEGFGEILEKELKRIKKKMVLRIELFIKRTPLLSLLMSLVIGIVGSVIAVYIIDLIKGL